MARAWTTIFNPRWRWLVDMSVMFLNDFANPDSPCPWFGVIDAEEWQRRGLPRSTLHGRIAWCYLIQCGSPTSLEQMNKALFGRPRTSVAGHET